MAPRVFPCASFLSAVGNNAPHCVASSFNYCRQQCCTIVFLLLDLWPPTTADQHASGHIKTQGPVSQEFHWIFCIGSEHICNRNYMKFLLPNEVKQRLATVTMSGLAC